MLPGVTPPIVSKGPVISSFIASTVVASSAASFNITMTPTTPGLFVLLAGSQGSSPAITDFTIGGSTMTLHLSSTLTTPGTLLGSVAIASQVVTSGALTITVSRASTSTNSNTHAFGAWVLTNYGSTTPVATTYTQLITTTTTVGTGIDLQYTAGASGQYLYIAGSSSDITWSTAVSRANSTSGVIRFGMADKQSNIPIASHTETVTLAAPSTTVGRRIVGATWR